jgi:hypothetical protein
MFKAADTITAAAASHLNGAIDARASGGGYGAVQTTHHTSSERLVETIWVAYSIHSLPDLRSSNSATLRTGTPRDEMVAYSIHRVANLHQEAEHQPQRSACNP